MGQSAASVIERANIALFAQRESGAVAKFFSPDYRAHFTDQDMAGGHAAVRKVVDSLLQSFPDLKVGVEILVEGPDRVAWLRRFHGTHQTAFKGFPGSGQQITWCDMVTSQVRDGLIVEEWVVTDLAERLLLSRKTRKE